MAIKVSCRCGQSFTAKDELEGQTLLCPKCHQPITIGTNGSSPSTRPSSDLDDLFEDVGLKAVQGRRCPSCGEAMQANAVLCVHCGFNTQTGQKMEGFRPPRGKASGEGHSDTAAYMLEQAKRQLEIDKVEEKKNVSQGAPAWVLLAALLLVVGFATTMYVMPRDQAFRITGMALFGLGGLVQIVCGLRILIIAFKEDIVCGLLYIFLPLYNLYYIITRWSRVGRIFLMALSAAGFQLLGLGFVALSPLLKSDATQQQVLAPPPQVHVMPAADLAFLSSPNAVESSL